MTRLSEDDYKRTSLEPLLRQLGYPVDDLSFCHENLPFKTYRDYRIDYLFHARGQTDRPWLLIEAKRSADLFGQGLAEAKDKARVYQEGLVVPFLISAAGEKVRMFEARPVASGLGVQYVPLGQVLSWSQLTERVSRLEQEAGRGAPESVLSSQEALKALQALYATLERHDLPPAASPDTRVVFMNDILVSAMRGEDVGHLFPQRPLPGVSTGPLELLGGYNLERLEGPNLAYAYRKFLERNFRGVGKVGHDQVRLGRYLTPPEFIRFMVRLANPQPVERVIDLACGSGGFLGELVAYQQRKVDANRYLRENLFACDIDPFAISTAKTFLELLLPGRQEDMNVFAHNGLYSEAADGDDDLSDCIEPGTFDLVIGNPPGNDRYSGSNPDFVARKLGFDLRRFGDAEAFVRRALQLAKREGGKICLILPEGFLANTRPQKERDAFFPRCELKAIISLPRIFPRTASKMAILYAVCRTRPRREAMIMASIQAGTDAEGNEYVPEAQLDEVLRLFSQMEAG